MADAQDPFSLNIEGVSQLIGPHKNKKGDGVGGGSEGVVSEKYDSLSVDMTDAELLALRDQYEIRYGVYEPGIKARVQKNRDSYIGLKKNGQWLADSEQTMAANIQWEATETFLAAALAKDPEPVVFADNSPEGNAVADAVKTMLQFHSVHLALQMKLSIMVRQWATDLLGVLKPGWNARINDVDLDNRQVRKYIFDPDGFVDAYGDFSSWYGERVEVSADTMVKMFPEHKAYIEMFTQDKLGTKVEYTEWWPTDEFCFITFKDRVLDKFKNPFFRYPEPVLDPVTGEPVIDEMTGEPQMSKPRNHFAYPKKPGIFLSVYTLREHPHDITSNLEQNIANQEIIKRRTEQVDFNVGASNNGYAFSEDNFNQETAKQAANARKKGNPILIPSGGPIDKAILALPAQNFPDAAFKELEIAKADLRTSWGVQGITAEPQDEDQTARGMILNQAHDSSRIGGGIGQSVENVASNAFNWLVQLYYVFYDQPHFAAVMGNAKAVEYIQLSSADIDRQLIVTVSPDSMKPKDEITNMNLAQALFDKGAIGPKTLLKMVNFPNPDEAAADGVLYKLDPAMYFKLNFPEEMARIQQQAAKDAQAAMVPAPGAPAIAGGAPAPGAPAPEAITEPKHEGGTARPSSSSSLSQVQLPPIPK